MISFKIHLEGNKEDAKVLDECIVELDDDFELADDPQTDVEIEELYGLDAIDVMEDLAISIASRLPECDFLLSGCIDTSELGGEIDDFSIEYRNKKLLVKHTGWYVWEENKDVPLQYEYELNIERQDVCPICGESLHQGVPVCEAADGTQYHIWCAEDAGIEGKLV